MEVSKIVLHSQEGPYKYAYTNKMNYMVMIFYLLQTIKWKNKKKEIMYHLLPMAKRR